MESFRGFSSEDIKHLHSVEAELNNSEDDELGDNLINDAQKISPRLSHNTSLKTKKVLKRNNYAIGKSIQNDHQYRYPVPEGAKFIQKEAPSAVDIQQNSLEMTPFMTLDVSDDTCTKMSKGSQSTPVTILVGEDKSYELISSPNCGSPINGDSLPSLTRAFLLEKNNFKSHDKISIEHFQERQKLMEEQNKRKKEILTRALADRKRQTQFEAKKLLQIQEELSRLDALLSTDVGILRNQIELASYEFNDAQKRYDKAESEFIEAKMLLFSKLERKELLTEHLCRIIEVNEQRKAKKLSELMAKLEISDDMSEHGEVVVSQSASFDKITNTYNDLTSSKQTKEEASKNVCNNPESQSNNSRSSSKSHCALDSINLVTAQNLDHRNKNASCEGSGNEDIKQIST